MRIVIDMQGAQTSSRFRGIGRYTMAFTQAVIKNRGKHEIILALSGLFPDTIEPIRAAFDGLLPQENIRVWHAPWPVCEEYPGNDSRRETSEILRESFLSSLHPDIIHITSLFEGYVDDAVTSIAQFDKDTPVSVILYDLIPLLNPEQYLNPNPRYEHYYLRKVEHLNHATLLLAISDFTSKEAANALGAEKGDSITISTGLDNQFQPITISDNDVHKTCGKFNITRPFVFYTGGVDERKNLHRLIDAYAALSLNLRDSYQLVFAGHIPEGNIDQLKQYSLAAGLKQDELILTGFVSDEDLVQLYNLCKLYVFPSWHEGFGLPALEAMACGAAVIASNTSSLPEVIGFDEALFDPFDVNSISSKISQVLNDETIHQRLIEHGLQQVKKFSWDETAQRAITAWEGIAGYEVHSSPYLKRSLAHEQLLKSLAIRLTSVRESELITLSHCLSKNECTGIERQLLLDVSELSQRDAATGVQRVVRSYLKWLLQSPPPGFRVEPVYATQGQGYRYARNFTLGFLGLDDAKVYEHPMRWQRGDLFFGLDMQHHVQLEHASLYRQLMSEGVVVKFLVYDLLPIQLMGLFKDSNAKELHEQWLAMITATDGAICISKATAVAFEDWINDNAIQYSPTFRTNWVHIGADIDSSNPSRGLPDDAQAVLHTLNLRPTFLSVSTIEPRKQQQQILEAVELLWQDSIDVNLVFVGQQGWKTEALAQHLRTHPEAGCRLFWLQGISDEYLEQIYSASTCLVAASINEGFGLPLIEASRHGIPILARDIPVFHEVAGKHATYFQGEAAHDVATALRSWLKKYHRGQHPSSTDISWLTWEQSTEWLKTVLVEQNYPRQQLLVDISELVQNDARTGIQRVVRNVLMEWLLNPPDGYRVEPVYATTEQGYRYARKYTFSFLNNNMPPLHDDPIDYAPGDIFFALDFQPQVQVAQQEFYQALRREGVNVKFMVYDLLCVLMPQYFPPGAENNFEVWLNVVTENDGAVCISRSVAAELSEWIKHNQRMRDRQFEVDWFHLGADVTHPSNTQNIPLSAESSFEHFLFSPTFLMVGTLEPRKGHAQIVKAFEQLWQTGLNVNLVIVGKQGWMVDDLVKKLRQHSELDKHLFWLEGISDIYLEKLYSESTCLIAASYGEGFGLPLIEAAQHKLPIIARDIPVFREVANDNAHYFIGHSVDEITKSIVEWLSLYKSGQAPESDGVKWITWSASATKLLTIVLKKESQKALKCL